VTQSTRYDAYNVQATINQRLARIDQGAARSAVFSRRFFPLFNTLLAQMVT